MSRSGTPGSWKSLAAWLAVLLTSAPSDGAPLTGAGEPNAPSAPAVELAEPPPAAVELSARGREAADLLVRTGFEDGSVFRLVETARKRGRWTQVNVGYVDSGDAGENRKLWLGGGAVVVDRPRLRLEVAAGLSRSAGTATLGERYIESSAYLVGRPRTNWLVEISHIESLPLNDTAVRQHALERARLEYEWDRYRFGFGYAGDQSGREAWEHRPFVSLTRPIGELGKIELWLQRVELPDGPKMRLQLRFARRSSS